MDMEKRVKLSNRLLCFLILLLLCNLSAVHGALAVRLCGQKLVNIIKVLCNHKYVSPQTVYSPGYYQRQPRSGIVESCCWKQCTYAYLKSYCDDPETTSTEAPTTTAVSWTGGQENQLVNAHGNHDSSQIASDGFPLLHRARQHNGARHQSLGGRPTVWHDETATVTAADTRRQVKTFRSLFHLLSYLSQFLSPVSPQSTTTQAPLLPAKSTTATSNSAGASSDKKVFRKSRV